MSYFAALKQQNSPGLGATVRLDVMVVFRSAFEPERGYELVLLQKQQLRPSHGRIRVGDKLPQP